MGVLVWPAMFGLSLVSAIVPFLPFEVLGLGLATQAPSGPAAAVMLGIMAGGGATVGKVIWYEAARRGIDSPWAQKKLSAPKVKAGYERWVARVEGRPIYAGLVMLLSASVGIPPLLVLAAVAGLVKMPMWIFIPTVFVGRSIRFALLFLGFDSFLDHLPGFLH